MPIDFPTSPALNDTYSFGGITWQWNGSAWRVTSGGGVAVGETGATGPASTVPGATGATGAASSVPGATGATGVGSPGATGATGAAGSGVPNGGSTGQALVKSSNADQATTWGDVVTPTGTQTLTNKTIGDLKEGVFTISDGPSVDLNPANGPIQTWVLGSNRSPTASNFGSGQSMMLRVDDGTGFTITWPSVVWVGGSAPTLATTGYTLVELFKIGSTLYGARVGDVAS